MPVPYEHLLRAIRTGVHDLQLKRLDETGSAHNPVQYGLLHAIVTALPEWARYILDEDAQEQSVVWKETEKAEAERDKAIKERDDKEQERARAVAACLKAEAEIERLRADKANMEQERGEINLALKAEMAEAQNLRDALTGAIEDLEHAAACYIEESSSVDAQRKRNAGYRAALIG